MVDAFEPWPLVICHREPGFSVSGVKFFGAPARVPSRLELRQEATDLREVNPVAPRVGSTVLGVFDARARDDLPDDLGEVPNPIVLVAMADIQRLVVDDFTRSGQGGQEGAGNIFDMHNGA